MPEMTQKDFDRILLGCVQDVWMNDLLFNIPGIYEILAEYFNNDVIEQWEYEQEIEAEAAAQDEEM